MSLRQAIAKVFMPSFERQTQTATAKLQSAFQSTTPVLRQQPSQTASSSYVCVSFPRKPIQYYG